ncbi:hypothetical protein FOWG_18265 [Fusarium oxysporum f. sp. lycopersici MN25]|nr:hypothetical protein FOWG_18265 [Fusarium oxysporum f. sp. lycopersici MN25]
MNTKGSILYSTGLLYNVWIPTHKEELFRGVKSVKAAETLHHGQGGVKPYDYLVLAALFSSRASNFFPILTAL